MDLRFKITPQMIEYYKIGYGHKWVPYLMYFHRPNYSSDVVNTDSRGLRVTYKGSNKISDFKNIDNESIGLFVGGSSAFGVGATSDRETIPSILNSISSYVWLNFGGRTFNSTQELLLFMFNYQHIDNIKNIIIFSGTNNIILHYLSKGYPKETGPFYYWSEYNQKMNTKSISLRRKLIESILPLPKREERSNKHNKNEREDLLYVLKRDILIWKLFTDSLGIKLCYILQPLANWVHKRLSKEEELIFKELDSSSVNNWRLVKDGVSYDQYLWFKDSIKEICESNRVSFFDINEAISKMRLDDVWLFVDRGHLTDTGNRIVVDILRKKVIDK